MHAVSLPRAHRVHRACFRSSFWARCTRDAKPGPQARFKENLELFFEAVHQQARDRGAGVIPDLDSYINVSVKFSVQRGARAAGALDEARLRHGCWLTTVPRLVRAGQARY